MQPDVRAQLEQLLRTGAQPIHLVGVCGSGMSGLARLLLAQGHRVSGSDLVSEKQAAMYVPEGVRYFEGHLGANIGEAKLVVFSSAISVENPERKTAAEKGVLCVRRAECLVVLADTKKTYVVAGSHGKTTTSSMLTYVLRQADANPSHYIGAQVPLLGANAAWTDGEGFVVEADESDGTLALFAPAASLILNIEEEHLDFYHDIEEIVQVFAQLCERTKGPIIYCADDKNAMLLCSHASEAIRLRNERAGRPTARSMCGWRISPRASACSIAACSWARSRWRFRARRMCATRSAWWRWRPSSAFRGTRSSARWPASAARPAASR